MRIKAREAREEKNKLLLEMAEQTEEQKLESRKGAQTEIFDSEKEDRTQMAYIRKRELEREQRLEYAGTKKSKALRD